MTPPPFTVRQIYPLDPGWKRSGTSQDAARSVKSKASTVREKVLQVLELEDMTADEVAAKLGEGILTVRPRLSELARQGKIIETGERRPNASGKSAMVWRARV